MKKTLLSLHTLPDRIITIILAVFIVVIALLTFSMIRHAELQQVADESGLVLLGNVEELQEKTEELQDSIDQLRTDNVETDNLETIEQQLDTLDEQLEQIEQTVDEVVPALTEIAPANLETAPEVIQDEIHRLFTAAAWLIGITSVIVAILAFIVFNPFRSTRQKRRLVSEYPPLDTKTRELP